MLLIGFSHKGGKLCETLALIHLVQNGTGFDMSTKVEVVSIVMVIRN